MVNLSIGLNFARRFLGKSTQKTGQTVEAAVTKMQPKTKSLTDPVTGAVKGLEREISLSADKKGLARIDYLGDGKRKITIFNENNNPYLWETKTITRENGESVFGGNRIVINKKKTKYWCYGEDINLRKDYDNAGNLQHKELSFNHNSGNGLNDYSYKASMDNVYSECKVGSGYKDMIKRPDQTEGVQHLRTRTDGYTENNYYKFGQKGTNYDNIINAKKAVEEAKIAEAKAAKEVAIKAEQEAVAKLEASRPKLNTSKLFNKNIDEFKCVEETKADGSVIRRYFDPYASNGKSNPMFTTIDQGNYHEEIIFDPRKDMKIVYKQFGDNDPEILMQKGWQYQQSFKYDRKNLYPLEVQQYSDGKNFVRNGDNNMPNHIVAKNPHSPEVRAERGEGEYIEWFSNKSDRLTSEQSKAIYDRYQEIMKGMEDNKI